MECPLSKYTKAVGTFFLVGGRSISICVNHMIPPHFRITMARATFAWRAFTEFCMLKPFSDLFLLFRKGVGGVGPGHDGLTGPWAKFLGAKKDCSGSGKRIGGNFPQGSYWFPVCISPKNPDTSPEVVSRTKLAPYRFFKAKPCHLYPSEVDPSLTMPLNFSLFAP